MPYPYSSDSWTVLNPIKAIKQVDKSVFNRGSGIPIAIRSFFEIGDMDIGDSRKVQLVLNGDGYQGKIQIDPLNRSRIFWNINFSEIIRRQFPDIYDIYEKDKSKLPINLPLIVFSKTTKIAYDISFINPPSIDNIEDDITSDEFENDFVNRTEGNAQYYYGRRFERDSKNRKKAIEVHGCFCNVCGFDFEKVYGDRGKGFIEVHHIKPLNNYDGREVEINPATDLIPLCSNCHSMIHRRIDNVLSIDELKKILHY